MSRTMRAASAADRWRVSVSMTSTSAAGRAVNNADVVTRADTPLPANFAPTSRAPVKSSARARIQGAKAIP